MRVMVKLVRFLFVCIVLVAIAGGVFAGVTIWYFGRDLPDYQQLAYYQPPITTRVHAGDGRLLAEYATERRVFVPIAAIPKRVIRAFLSAEDKNFYSHHGVDPLSILRAAVTDIGRWRGKRRPIGASTITQQVAKNMLLSNELSISRKIKEILLATRIDEALPKDRILELYLNEIYLGAGAYGVASAALTYFDKPLGQLSLGEAAFLAGLPKAPNNYSPTRFPQAAKARRDWVLDRIMEDGYASAAEVAQAKAEPLAVHHREEAETVSAPYFAEEVRRQLLARYGEKTLYEGGLSVRTSLDPAMQAAADKALRAGLVAYDRARGGWRGAVGHIDPGAGWPRRLAASRCRRARRRPAGSWRWCCTPKATARRSGSRSGETGHIPFAQMRWARPLHDDGTLGPAPRHAADVVKPGDLVLVEKLAAKAGKPAPGTAGCGGGGRSVRFVPDSRRFRRARRDRPAYRPGAGDERRVQLRVQPVQPRHPGQAAGGVVDQAVRLPDGAGTRVHPVDADPRRADRALSGSGAAALGAAQLRGQISRADHDAGRARTFGQRHGGPHRGDRRHGRRRRDGREIRHHGPHAARILDVARRRRDHAAAPDRRLCDARQWREAHHPDPDRPGAGPQRQDHLSRRHPAVRGLQ